jgi:hypothetical protein
MTGEAIPMEGRDIQGFTVLDRAPRLNPRGAVWWVLCPRCREQFPKRGTTLRQCVRDGTAPQCPRCRT